MGFASDLAAATVARIAASTPSTKPEWGFVHSPVESAALVGPGQARRFRLTLTAARPSRVSDGQAAAWFVDGEIRIGYAVQDNADIRSVREMAVEDYADLHDLLAVNMQASWDAEIVEMGDGEIELEPGSSTSNDVPRIEMTIALTARVDRS